MHEAPQLTSQSCGPSSIIACGPHSARHWSAFWAAHATTIAPGWHASKQSGAWTISQDSNVSAGAPQGSSALAALAHAIDAANIIVTVSLLVFITNSLLLGGIRSSPVYQLLPFRVPSIGDSPLDTQFIEYTKCPSGDVSLPNPPINHRIAGDQIAVTD
jgi:hypothetical protein